MFTFWGRSIHNIFLPNSTIIRRFTFFGIYRSASIKAVLKKLIYFFWEGDRRENLMLHSVKKQLLWHWYEAIRIIYHRSKSNYLGLLSQYCNCGVYRVSTTADIENDRLNPQTSVILCHFFPPVFSYFLKP